MKCYLRYTLVLLLLLGAASFLLIGCGDDDDDNDNDDTSPVGDDDDDADDVTDDDTDPDDDTGDDDEDDPATDDAGDSDTTLPTDPDDITWEIEAVYDNMIANDGYFDLAFTPEGDPMIAFHEPENIFNPLKGTLLLATRTADNKGWVTSILDDSTDKIGMSPRIDIDSTGRIAVGYMSYASLLFADLKLAIKKPGADWSIVTLEEGNLFGGPSGGLDLMFDENDRLFLAVDQMAGNGIHLYVEETPDNFTTTSLFSDVSIYDGVDLDINSNGKPGFAWYHGENYDEYNEYGEVYAGYPNASGSYTASMLMRHPVLNGLGEEMSFVWRQGGPIIFYYAKDDTNYGVYFQEMVASVWHNRMFVDPCEQVAGPADAVTDSDNQTVWVAYSCEFPDKVPAVTRYRTQAVFYDVLPDGARGVQPVIDIAPDGYPAIAYWDNANNALGYAKAVPLK